MIVVSYTHLKVGKFIPKTLAKNFLKYKCIADDKLLTFSSMEVFLCIKHNKTVFLQDDAIRLIKTTMQTEFNTFKDKHKYMLLN